MTTKKTSMIIRWCTRSMLALLALLILLFTVLIATGWYIAQQQNQDRLKVRPTSGMFVQAADTQIFVQSRGAANAPAVMFVHGTGAWSEVWSASMDDVVGLGYRAVAIDLPPFGYSVPPVSGKYDKGSQARRILGVLDSLHIQKAVFVAHSIGSGPLMEAVLQSPERVSKLILVCGALGLDGPQTDGSDSRLQSILRHPYVTETLTSAIFTNPAFTKMLVSSFVVEKNKITPAWLEIYQRPLSLSGSYQSIAQWIPELIAGRGKWLSDNPDMYRQITFPVKLIWGQFDNITPITQAHHLQELIPGSELVVIPNSGHVPMVEEPASFKRELVNALPLIISDSRQIN